MKAAACTGTHTLTSVDDIQFLRKVSGDVIIETFVVLAKLRAFDRRVAPSSCRPLPVSMSVSYPVTVQYRNREPR
jgi:hypothetical protein